MAVKTKQDNEPDNQQEENRERNNNREPVRERNNNQEPVRERNNNQEPVQERNNNQESVQERNNNQEPVLEPENIQGANDQQNAGSGKQDNNTDPNGQQTEEQPPVIEVEQTEETRIDETKADLETDPVNREEVKEEEADGIVVEDVEIERPAKNADAIDLRNLADINEEEEKIKKDNPPIIQEKKEDEKDAKKDVPPVIKKPEEEEIEKDPAPKKEEPPVEEKQEEKKEEQQSVNNDATHDEPPKEEKKEEKHNEMPPIDPNADGVQNQEIKDNIDAQEANQQAVADIAVTLTAAELSLKGMIEKTAQGNAEKGLTLKELGQMDCIRKSNGDRFETRAQADTPYNEQEFLQEIMDEAKQGDLYIVDPLSKDSEKPQLSMLEWDEKNNQFLAYKTTVQKEFIDPEYKKNMVDRLRKIRDDAMAMGTTRNDSRKFIDFIEKLDKTIPVMENNEFKEDFKKNFQEVTDAAEVYRQEKIGQKPNARRVSRIDAARELSVLNTCVQKDRDEEELIKDTRVQAMQRDIAEKFVKAYAMKRAKLDSPTAKKEAKMILEDPEYFKKKVDAAMQQDFFKNLYGGTDELTQKRLEEASSRSVDGVFKQVMGEVKNPSARVVRQDEKVLEFKPLRKDEYTKHFNYSPDVEKDFKRTLADISREMSTLSKRDQGPGLFGDITQWNSSSRYKALDDEMYVAMQLLNSDAEYLDYGRIAAKLGDAADRYFDTKTKSGYDDYGSLGMKRVQIAQKIRAVADAMNQGKKPSENVPNEMSSYRDYISTKIVQQQIETLSKSKKPSDNLQANILRSNPKAFEATKEKLETSDAFKNLINGKSLKELGNLAKKSKGDLTKMVMEETSKLLGPKNKKVEKTLEDHIEGKNLEKNDKDVFVL